ncbi:MAG TPA: YbdK family carboxylate-amine ligase [Solirubrobacteraceae bacterium]|nr:YbdK family carboxylate-amine ligase [Solirubrobacteraceae bacterium]
MANLPSIAELRARFEAVTPFTVGIEEELMLLDPGTLELTAVAPALLERLSGDARFKLELPASHLEIALGPFAGADELAPALREARGILSQAASGLALPAAAGAHPFSPPVGTLNSGARYAAMIARYEPVAVRQLVCALQVHVAVGGADRTLAVYNGLRSYLPLLAALAANAPFYEGADTGLASVRPKLCELLPRQGVPPVIESWEQHLENLEWGARADTMADAGMWWWELRPHLEFGTLEIRVPDSQSSVADVAAVAAVAHALAVWLAERHEAGELLSVAPTWRIEENRWSACHHGPAGSMADLESGELQTTRAVLELLFEALEPTVVRLQAMDGLRHAADLAAEGGAAAQRAAAGTGGARAATRWLADRFLAE